MSRFVRAGARWCTSTLLLGPRVTWVAVGVSSAEEAAGYVEKMIGNVLVTKQTGPEGQLCTKVCGTRVSTARISSAIAGVAHGTLMCTPPARRPWLLAHRC